MVVEGGGEMEGGVPDIGDEQNNVRYLQHPPQLPPGLAVREGLNGNVCESSVVCVVRLEFGRTDL